MHIFAEGAVVIADVVKAAFGCNQADFVVGVLKKLHALLNSVIVQIGKRRHVRHGFKQAADMSFAQMKVFFKL